jgi:KUP system potassium uptake protein
VSQPAAQPSEASRSESGPGRRLGAGLLIATLGVVYGDIGTSPLYALKEAVRAASPGGDPSPVAVTGAVSLILWALILVVSLKYAVLILRADNRGEGGIVAMLALLGARHAQPGSRQALLLVVGLVGAALLYGDGAITPAISVLSAVEGLRVDAPALDRFIVPITLVILVGLFFVQRRGAAFIGKIFGPVMLVWFLVLAALGLGGIVQAPQILAAVNPLRAVEFTAHAGLHVGFTMLGAAFLAVTGGEAMYADLGHFGARAIRVAWFVLVLPALVVHYFGQGAILLVDPSAAENPFYRLAPSVLHYPLIGLATLAAVIASQAVISGVFSLTRQSIQLGFLPPLHIVHTASDESGQIYVPLVNWLLAAATLSAVLIFRSSDALAGAYGIAVSLLMAITTLLAGLVARKWGFGLPLVLAVNGFFLVIDLIFLSANSVKLFEGGWFPLLLAGIIAFLMLTWRKGQLCLEQARVDLRPPEARFLESLRHDPPTTLPGSAAFLSSATEGIPLPMMRFVERLGALHARVLIVTALFEETPTVPREERARVTEITPDIRRVVLHYGFMQSASIPEGLDCAVGAGLLPKAFAEDLTVFVGHETIIPVSDQRGMSDWREAVFAVMQNNAERTGAHFCVPARQVIEIGTEIEI